MDIKAALTRRGEILQKMEDLDTAAAAETRDLTEDESKQYTDLEAEVTSINAGIERQQKRDDLERVHNHGRGVSTVGHWDGVVEDDEPEPAFADSKNPPIVYRGLDAPGISDDAEREHVRLCTAFGQQLLDIKRSVTGHGTSQQLQTIQAAAQGAGENVGSDGGFLVQTDVGGMLARGVMGGEVLSRVRQVPLGPNANGITFNAVDETSRATGSRWGGVRGYWVDEGTAPTGSQPQFRRVELRLNKVAALGYATDELEMDATAFGSIMVQAFTEELRWLVENAIMRGTGAGQPHGIIGGAATVTVARATASEVNQADLSGMWARLHTRSKAGSVWLGNTDINPELDTMFVAGASSDLSPRFITYDAEGTTRMKGKPFVEVEYCSTLGTEGDLVVADLSSYLFVSKVMQTASSMHVRFTTDENAYRVTWRVDGRSSWVSALTPANGTNTLSPFIVLTDA